MLNLIQRPHEGVGTKSWDVRCKRLKGFEGPQLYKLTSKLVNLKKNSNKNIVDYLKRADTNHNLTLVNEDVSEKKFISINLKELHGEHESSTTLMKFSKEESVRGI